MKSKTSKILAGMLTVGLCLSLSACGAKEEPPKQSKANETTQQTESVSAEQAGMTIDPSKAGGDAQSAGAASGKFKPSEYTVKSQDIYKYPFLGLELILPEPIKEKMNKKEIAMLTHEEFDASSQLNFAFASWNNMTTAQKDEMVDKMGDGYFKWQDALDRIGTIGMYKKDITEDKISELTRCKTHTKVGESADKKYNYYLSTNDTTGADELKKAQIKIVNNEPANPNMSAFSEMTAQSTKQEITGISNLKTQTIDGKDFTQSDFSKYDLTMVNVFTTWCTACVNEIPELEKLHQEMKDKGVNVVGVVLDTVDDNGENKEIIEKAKLIQEKTKATYSFLKPDSTYFNGRLMGIQGFPETFFVDKNGNIVGETVLGSRDFNGWKNIVEKELKDLKEKK
ncbi:redoxin [Peptostreptococcaceae bacterium AS15]|nr:redoxin [Peptostreptococcaceae bacterium AS15]